ncbi:hypothetical protein Acsp01_84090 [Actinoplanes sp. NBRC 101535]|nr:hypothetical protein Acsp01_84090 [Actinoplanes sp. NBRC 101535]
MTASGTPWGASASGVTACGWAAGSGDPAGETSAMSASVVTGSAPDVPEEGETDQEGIDPDPGAAGRVRPWRRRLPCERSVQPIASRT